MLPLLAIVTAVDAPLLLADWDDTLRAVVPIVFMILYGIAQLLSNRGDQNKRGAPKQALPRRAPPPPPPERGPAPPQASTLEETLRREVDQFLQRTKGQQQPAPRSPDQRRHEPKRRTPAPPMREQSAPSRPAPMATGPLESGPLGSGPLVPAPSAIETLASATYSNRAHPVRETIAQHVQQHIGAAREVGDHADQLGDEVALADERMNRHLIDRFEHRLGSLERQKQPAAPPPAPVPVSTASTAAEFLALLSQPSGIRQAIIASEILRRPDF